MRDKFGFFSAADVEGYNNYLKILILINALLTINQYSTDEVCDLITSTFLATAKQFNPNRVLQSNLWISHFMTVTKGI